MKKYLSDIEVRDVEFGILENIDKICKENNIKYFLDYGTLLGAVRHKGFIPWDDDIDICMLRDDYVKFCVIYNDATTSQYRLLTSENDSNFPYEMGKVVDTRTKLQEADVISSTNMGVWVDVFPKDYIPRHHTLLRLCLFITFVFRIFAVYEKFPSHRNKLFYPVWLLARCVGFRSFLKINNFLIGLCAKCKDSQFIGNIRDFSSNVFYWEKSMFDEVDYVEFSGRLFPAPKQWDEYLKGLYGNYMILPPENKRKRHKFNVYWR